ncbi:hypothetical protein LY76DRAFT_594118 [Colletotrichum caudatum]|nr:hypothetical protein LY76DRAFT_594118 [Colletotrichum caudatum]
MQRWPRFLPTCPARVVPDQPVRCRAVAVAVSYLASGTHVCGSEATLIWNQLCFQANPLPIYPVSLLTDVIDNPPCGNKTKEEKIKKKNKKQKRIVREVRRHLPVTTKWPGP